MSDKYINYGQVGAMGNNASASNFTIKAGENSSYKLSKNNIEDLVRLIEALSDYTGKEVKKSEVMNASMIVQEIVENVEEGNEEDQSKSISKWRTFIKNSTPALINVINAVSATVGVASEIKNLLGI